ncbi:cupin domain-containing protein [Paracoccus sp. Z118]|uniref:(R)-mandelonitrile lyase n=1 Tax=Paracoccus sp. Z118 TaxID=2851017 RepID=UPI001C2BFB16|nr:cupin domain-containing protein [Paracoccus sp. Z118]MBV0893205.1 cupin domain-containing protein [Paracoccus sp. Z118]
MDAITIKRLGSQPATKGSPAWFTGEARVESPFKGTGDARIAGATVVFTPGARTAWHTHPLGQTLIVTAGVGRIGLRGGPIQEMRPGDTVWIPAGLEHWHGASPHFSMTHIAFSEAPEGRSVDWLEQVSDDDYNAKQG